MLDNPRNKAFVGAFQKKFNELPSVFSGTHYDGMSWVLDVVLLVFGLLNGRNLIV